MLGTNARYIGSYVGLTTLPADAYLNSAYGARYTLKKTSAAGAEVAEVYLEAGEYVITYEANSQSASFYGGTLTLIGSVAPVTGNLEAGVTGTVEVSTSKATEIPLSASITTGGVTTPVALTDANVSNARVDVSDESAFVARYENGKLIVSAKEGAPKGITGSATVYMVLNNEVTAWCEVQLQTGYAVTYRYNQHRLSIMGGVTAHADKGAQNGNYWQPALENLASIWNTAAGHSENVLNPKANSSQFTGPYDTDGAYDSTSKIANDFGTMPFALADKGNSASFGITAGYGFGAGAVSGARAWYAMEIMVPQTNTYAFRGHFYPAQSGASHTDTVYVELIPKAEWNPSLAMNYGKYLIGFFSGTNALPAGVDSPYRATYMMWNYSGDRVEGATFDIEAGEYVVVYSSGANGKPLWGGSLELLGVNAAVNGQLTPDEDVLNAEGEFVAYKGVDNAIELTPGFIRAVEGEKVYTASDWASVEATNVRVDKNSDQFTAVFEDGKLKVTVSDTATVGAAGSATVSMVLDGEATAWCEIPINIQEKPDVKMEMNEGASVRLRAPQGIRFYATIDKTTAGWNNVVEYGMVLVPTRNLTDVSALVVGAKFGNDAVAQVVANKLYRAETDYNEYTTVLYNLLPAHYDMSVTARAYAKLDNGSYIYSDTVCQRSIRQIALNGLELSTDEEEIRVFEKIRDGLEIDNTVTPAE